MKQLLDKGFVRAIVSVDRAEPRVRGFLKLNSSFSNLKTLYYIKNLRKSYTTNYWTMIYTTPHNTVIIYLTYLNKLYKTKE